MGNSETIEILSERQLEKMRQAGRLAAKLLQHLESMVKPGANTLEINNEAERWTKAHGAKSAPLGYRGFPKSICTSINEVVCHGIPSKKQILRTQTDSPINIVLLVVYKFHSILGFKKRTQPPKDYYNIWLKHNNIIQRSQKIT